MQATCEKDSYTAMNQFRVVRREQGTDLSLPIIYSKVAIRIPKKDQRIPQDHPATPTPAPEHLAPLQPPPPHLPTPRNASHPLRSHIQSP